MTQLSGNSLMSAFHHNQSNNILFGNEDQSLLTVLPNHQILDHSVQVITPCKKFTDLSEQHHSDSYQFLQRIVQIWKNSCIADQHLTYAKINSDSFTWDVVPCPKCHSWISRKIQLIILVFRILFGGKTVTNESRQQQLSKYGSMLNKTPNAIEPPSIPSKGEDVFCKKEVIDSQSVLEGNKTQIIFNYAPIGFGGERLHFLIIPKQHRETFSELTKEEYCESLALSQKLIKHFSATRKVHNVYLQHKSGKDAGQTVYHWHLHVIISTNKSQEFWGRLTFLKNIIFGPSILSPKELEKTVDGFKKELAYLP